VLLVFNKPYGVLSQFTPDGSPNRPLADFHFPTDVYPIGRLDADSEGLLLLSDEPQLNFELLDPERSHQRTYWVQVEGLPGPQAIRDLQRGVLIQGRRTRPCKAEVLDPQPVIPAREPPIRFRKSVPTTWIELSLTEGRNRQVRRMTASVGHPTLRLIRVAIGAFRLGDLQTGQWREMSAREREQLFARSGTGAPNIQNGR
jgi:23S rRNA pseudouridine2457 synthase